jgi:two-component system, cell cycle sensor histidine kinase and response regulator CckA
MKTGGQHLQGETMPERNPLGAEPGGDCGGRSVVLVVDDDSAIREIIRRVLEDNGHTVFEAKDGLDGLETFRRDPHRFHAVILDLEMPRMNGIDAFREMRAIRTDIPVIVASGGAPDEFRHRLPVAELAGILRKPFKLDELLCAVSRCVPPERIRIMRPD